MDGVYRPNKKPRQPRRPQHQPEVTIHQVQARLGLMYLFRFRFTADLLWKKNQE